MCTGEHEYIPVVNTAEVRMQFSDADGNHLENVLHYFKTDGWEVEDLIDLGQEVYNVWHDNVREFVASSVSLERIICTDLSSAISPSTEFTSDLPEAGTNASPALPGNVTIALKKVTSFRGRSFRGRIYFIGAVEAGVTGNHFNDLYRNDIVAAYGNFITLTGGTMGAVDMVVVSYCQNGEWLPSGAKTIVTAISTADNNVDSQRRRLTGRGN